MILPILLISATNILGDDFPAVNRLITRSFTFSSPFNNFGASNEKEYTPRIIIRSIRVPRPIAPLENLEGFYNNSYPGAEPNIFEDESNEHVEKKSNELSDSSSEKNEKPKSSIWRRSYATISNMLSGPGLVRALVVALVILISIGVGYQIRKSEEHSNYVRLPASA